MLGSLWNFRFGTSPGLGFGCLLFPPSLLRLLVTVAIVIRAFALAVVTALLLLTLCFVLPSELVQEAFHSPICFLEALLCVLVPAVLVKELVGLLSHEGLNLVVKRPEQIAQPLDIKERVDLVEGSNSWALRSSGLWLVVIGVRRVLV